jgi:hypothetical protein
MEPEDGGMLQEHMKTIYMGPKDGGMLQEHMNMESRGRENLLRA